MSKSSNKQKIDTLNIFLKQLKKEKKDEWRNSITNPQEETIKWRKGKVYVGI